LYGDAIIRLSVGPGGSSRLAYIRSSPCALSNWPVLRFFLPSTEQNARPKTQQHKQRTITEMPDTTRCLFCCSVRVPVVSGAFVVAEASCSTCSTIVAPFGWDFCNGCASMSEPKADMVPTSSLAEPPSMITFLPIVKPAILATASFTSPGCTDSERVVFTAASGHEPPSRFHMLPLSQ